MQKRLFRSGQNRIIAGVCGGLADYFSLDPTLVRVGMVALIFFDGIGIIAYIVMALIVPNEEMKGASPGQVVEGNIEELAQTAETIGERVGSAVDGQHLLPRVLGGAIVLFGIVMLLRNFNLMFWVDTRWMWPGILIVCGLAIILHEMRRR